MDLQKPTVTWETFVKSINQIVEVSNQIFDGWFHQGTKGVEGGFYIVKRGTSQKLNTALSEEVWPRTDELDDLEEALESDLEDKCCINKSDEADGIALTREYHVVYSLSYSVPVLYFNTWTLDGKLLDLEETWDSVHSSMKPRLKRDKWQTLTQTIHPILQRPFFQFHPCGTASLLQAFTALNCNPVVTWLSSVGPLVDLELRAEYSRLAL